MQTLIHESFQDLQPVPAFCDNGGVSGATPKGACRSHLWFYRDGKVRCKFISGVLEELRRACTRSRPDSFQLAVDLATRYSGEIINADAMQMYKGLPIITNKISSEERRGIPHHLFDRIALDQETWWVGQFREEASKTIQEIRSRGKLPIVVGGTHYYITGLLFDDKLVREDPPSLETNEPQGDSASKYPILGASAEVMLEKLREVDPAMADRWHPNDTRKIRRSLEIYLTTGKRASDIYAEQQERKESKRTSDDGLTTQSLHDDALLFWVHTDRKMLTDRLDRRVDKMLHNGLIDETQELYRYLQAEAASGQPVDRSRGIWQSIGFAQFEPYLQALEGEATDMARLEQLRSKGIEETQAATRRYAQYQIKWITKKLVPPLREEGLFRRLYVLDSTNIDRFKDDVLEQGSNLTKRFLEGEALPDPAELSATAQQVLTSTAQASSRKETPCRKVCQICHVTLVTEEAWQRHIQGTPHRRVAKRMKKRALVAAAPRQACDEETATLTEQVLKLSLDAQHPP